MGINDLPWRKFPRSAINDIQLDYISSLMDERLKAAPLLFFVTMFCLADDDGCFDVEDGVIFSRAMKCGTPEDIQKLAAYFEERHLIMKIDPKMTIYMITDWVVPDRGAYHQTPLTAEERRESVRKKIQSEKSAAAAIRKSRVDAVAQKALEIPFYIPSKLKQDVPTTGEAARMDVPEKGKEEKTSGRKFLYPHNDKKRRFVAMDTEGENREQNTDSTVQNGKDTHTQEAAHEANQTEEDPAEPEEKETGETGQCTEDSGDSGTGQAKELRREEGQETEQKGDGNARQETEKETGKKDVRIILGKFFKQHNPAGFGDENKQNIAIQQITEKIGCLADERNPAEMIACQYEMAFTKLSASDGYYKGAALLPSIMLSDAIWYRLTERVAKILAGSGENRKKWEEELEKNRIAVEKQREDEENARKKLFVGDGVEKLYLESGVDPEDPDRVRKLLNRKQVEKRE